MADLFDYEANARSEQDENLARVTGAIGASVLSFCRERGVHGTFHAKDLHDYVGAGVAPASADRILRHMRREGYIDYEVVNRRASFYRLLAIKNPSPRGDQGRGE